MGRLCEMTHTGLLGRVVMMALIAGGALGSPGEPCSECYQPLCEEEEVSSWFRVHINSNPNCVNLSQLVLYQEDKRVYWITQNTATFRQQLLGECPIGEAWLCFECDVAEASLVDPVKRKEMVKTVRKMVCKKYLALKNSATRWIPRDPNKLESVEKKERDKCNHYEVHEYYECTEKRINPFWKMKELCRYCECPTETSNTFQESPKHLGLISGTTAYTKLSGDWPGSCTARIIKPAFFLLPKETGSSLRVPIYNDLRKNKQKKQSAIEIGRVQNCKSQVQIPISMVNRIIRLRAVLEIKNAIVRNISNKIKKLKS